MTIWTKYSLAESVNQRVDRGIFGLEAEYIMPLDISDDSLEHFQEQWDSREADPTGRESEFSRLYQSIRSGW